MIFLISNFFSAIIQSHQRFLIPALSPVIYNLGIIVAILFFTPVWGIWSPVFGVILGAILHLLIQIPLALKLGFNYKPLLNKKIRGVSEVFRLMIPRTMALAVYQVEETIAVFLATSLSPGSCSTGRPSSTRREANTPRRRRRCQGCPRCCPTRC